MLARFSEDYFLSHNTETFVEETFSVSLFWVLEKFDAQEGYITIFCRNFFVSLPKKIRGGTLLFFKKILVSEMSMHRKSEA